MINNNTTTEFPIKTLVWDEVTYIPNDPDTKARAALAKHDADMAEKFMNEMKDLAKKFDDKKKREANGSSWYYQLHSLFAEEAQTMKMLEDHLKAQMYKINDEIKALQKKFDQYLSDVKSAMFDRLKKFYENFQDNLFVLRSMSKKIVSVDGETAFFYPSYIFIYNKIDQVIKEHGSVQDVKSMMNRFRYLLTQDPKYLDAELKTNLPEKLEVLKDFSQKFHGELLGKLPKFRSNQADEEQFTSYTTEFKATMKRYAAQLNDMLHIPKIANFQKRLEQGQSALLPRFEFDDDQRSVSIELHKYQQLYLRSSGIIDTDHKRAINDLCLLGNTYVATASDDTTVKIWKIKTGERKLTLTLHKSKVLALANMTLKPGTKVQAKGAKKDATTRVTSAKERGKSAGGRGAPNGKTQPEKDYSPSEVLLSGDDSGVLAIWEIQNFSCLSVINAHDDSLTQLVGIGDGCSFLSCSSDNVINVWDITKLDKLSSFTVHQKEQITSICVRGDRKRFFSVGFDATLNIYDIVYAFEDDAEKRICRKATLTDTIETPDVGTMLNISLRYRDLLFVGTLEGKVDIWNIAKKAIIASMDCYQRKPVNQIIIIDEKDDESQDCTSIETVQAVMITTTIEDPVIRLWDVQHGTKITELRNENLNMFSETIQPTIMSVFNFDDRNYVSILGSGISATGSSVVGFWNLRAIAKPVQLP